jgi:hypothetical protein
VRGSVGGRSPSSKQLTVRPPKTLTVVRQRSRNQATGTRSGTNSSGRFTAVKTRTMVIRPEHDERDRQSLQQTEDNGAHLDERSRPLSEDEPGHRAEHHRSQDALIKWNPVPPPEDTIPPLSGLFGSPIAGRHHGPCSHTIVPLFAQTLAACAGRIPTDHTAEGFALGPPAVSLRKADLRRRTGPMPGDGSAPREQRPPGERHSRDRAPPPD